MLRRCAARFNMRRTAGTARWRISDLYSLKSLDGALQDLNETLRLKPDYIDAQALRGAVQYEADRWDGALEDFRSVFSQVARRRPPGFKRDPAAQARLYRCSGAARRGSI